MSTLVAGVDFGSDELRVVVYEAASGEHLMLATKKYPRWAQGSYCDPRAFRFRQHPLDHLECLEACFAEVSARLGPRSIAALAIDTTGSTPAPVDATGTPLALLPEFAEEPDAMFWLWKDRTSVREAERVNAVLSSGPVDHTRYQGSYSSEWWWAKILRAVTINPRIREHAHSWVEHSDWLPNMLVGGDRIETFHRNACAAGHKTLFNRRLGGLPDRAALKRLDPYLARLLDTYAAPPSPAGTPVGTLSEEWARRLDLAPTTVVGMGSLDAAAGAVGANVGPGVMVKTVGTSSVDIFVVDYEDLEEADLRDACGLAEDSLLPGHLGGETSQAAFGDLFAWYARLLQWPAERLLRPDLEESLGVAAADRLIDRMRQSLLPALEEAALGRQRGGITALDWINGRRYPDVDEGARAALTGLAIGDDAVDVYRALADAAVLGSKAIHEALAAGGLRFERAVLVGGIPRKSPMICQAIADALGVEVMVSQEPEVCAKGAGIHAAVALGLFPDIISAQRSWCAPFAADHRPDPHGAVLYDRLFEIYRRTGDRLSGLRTDASREEVP